MLAGINRWCGSGLGMGWKSLLQAHPKVRFKYNLDDRAIKVRPLAVFDLALEIAKASQAGYAASIFRAGIDPLP